MLDEQLSRHMVEWADESLARGQHILATSNQGTILHYAQDGVEYAIKSAMGTGAVRRARQTTLEREYQAYATLTGVTGVPQCLGLLDGRYLVLEFIHGVAYRQASIPNREEWFAELLVIIRHIHERGVSHGDLKSKSNLMMTADGRPCIIDFGTTVVYREGFHPFNHWLFNYLKRLDLNAWVKHKYEGRYEDAAPEDRKLLNYSRFERWLRRYRKWRYP